MKEHELGLTTFLAEPSRRRIRTLLELGPKRRKDMRALLDHGVELDGLHAHPLAGRNALADAVEAALRRHGAPDTCHLVSAVEALDGREMPLADALEAIAASGSGGFISCIPGRLGYFEYEGATAAYLLRK